MIKTITLDGLTSVTVKESPFDMARFCWVRNRTESDVYISCTDTQCTPNADGVKCITAGECGMLDSESRETLYISGSGVVNIETTPFLVCPFNRGGKGGVSYELPIATTEILGGVMVDGTSITADEQGVISAVGSGGGLEFIGEYYVSSSTGLTTIISKADYKEGDIYLILVRSNSNTDWNYCIYALTALPTSPQIKPLNCIPSVGTSARSVSIRLDSVGLSVSDQAYYKFYKMKVG